MSGAARWKGNYYHGEYLRKDLGSVGKAGNSTTDQVGTAMFRAGSVAARQPPALGKTRVGWLHGLSAIDARGGLTRGFRPSARPRCMVHL